MESQLMYRLAMKLNFRASIRIAIALALLCPTLLCSADAGIDAQRGAAPISRQSRTLSQPELQGTASSVLESTRNPQPASNQPIGQDPGKGYVRLPGHVLDALAKATPIAPEGSVPLSTVASAANQEMTLTLVLKRDDQAGFDHYMKEVYDPHSKHYRRFLTQTQITKKFGPSRKGYEQVLSYLRGQGFKLAEGSKNRLTLTVRGTRAGAERAFALHIGNYQIGDRRLYANDLNPALPRGLASHVESIAGLSNLAVPHNIRQAVPPPPDYFACPSGVAQANCSLYGPLCAIYAASRSTGEYLQEIGNDLEGGLISTIKAYNTYNENTVKYFADCLNGNFTDLAAHRAAARSIRSKAGGPPVPWLDTNGAGQTIGLVEFDTFQLGDIANFLGLINAPVTEINNLSQVNVNGGATLGAGEGEVVLDIDAVMTLAPAAKVVVYDAPFTGAGTSFQSVLNKMVNDGVSVISNSWAYCENQTTAADVQSIDSILQSAAAAGISVFSGSGDTGSSCLDGSANTIAVPADSPNLTAVGGTTLSVGPGGVYLSEAWWDGTAHTPQTGQGGFGVSRFFTRPAYQNGFNTSPMRSIPDVTVAADPAGGMVICEADAGGCPTGQFNG
ncbi:MAG: S53 family peptidase, partial [Stenotrophobium sp.]